MVIDDLEPDEQFAANTAWYLACAEKPLFSEPATGVLFELGGEGAPANYRMQSFIREWALFGYEPAQTLLAKYAAKRMQHNADAA